MNKWKMQKEIRNAEIEQREFLKGKDIELNVSRYDSNFLYRLFHNGQLWYCNKNKDQTLDYIYFLDLKVKKITHYNYNVQADLPF